MSKLERIETRSDAILTAMRECHRIGANDIYARDIANILNIPQKNAVAAMNKMATQKKIERELIGRILVSGFDDSVDGDIKWPLIKLATATGDEVCDAAEDLEPHLRRLIEGRK